MRTDDIELLLRTVSVNTCTRMGHVYDREIGHTENQLVVAVVKGVVAKPTLLLVVSKTEKKRSRKTNPLMKSKSSKSPS